MSLDKIKGHVRKFEVGVHITLFEIDLTPVGGGVYYFTNTIFEERIPIRFAGHNYIPLTIDMTGLDVDSQGSPAQPNLVITTSGGPIASLIQQYKDLRKGLVKRYVTFAEYLDVRPDGLGGVEANPDADGTARIKQELYVVNRKTSANDVSAEFELKSPADMDGVMLPLRILRKRWCDAKYRVPNDDGTFTYFPVVDGGCPYAGPLYFDVNGNPTTLQNDRCSKEIGTGCLKRFGDNNPLPFMGQPGIRAAQEA